ncbi:uncharacterized protein LOC123218880 [Mangifera indica]|uniref:uncharacterized protein LOC123218880 n=1 Tax=Mangifera indica TaxID=29780 RepID=UPI001CFA0EEE|nr:uncharacterized protein LOC123218880 [Mangifera indica]
MSTYHIAMYPWFAMGHLTAFFHMANKLAERGHKISFLLPAKTLLKLQPFNHHKLLIHCIPITVPSVNGLPPGAETTNDIPSPLQPLLMSAMDLTRPAIEAILSHLKPRLLFFDYAHWVPELTQKLGIKSINFCIVSSATISYLLSPERKLCQKVLTEADLLHPPQGFPPSKIKLHIHEAQQLAAITMQDYGGLSFAERILTSFNECDAVGFKACREMEGAYCDYTAIQLKKPVLLAGPVVPEPPTLTLEKQWETLLASFKAKSLIFCAFGSECIMEKTQFQELVLGFELTGLPFLAALKPPMGHGTIESALPQGFEERVKGRGYIHGGWIQQQLILKHRSVGCFVTHCGSGSLTEGMVSDCQLVLAPNTGDQYINARLMSGDLKVGIEIEKGDEDGLFTRDDVCKAVKAAMDDDSEVGKEIRENHAKWREFLSREELEKSYIDFFVQELHGLCNEGSKESKCWNLGGSLTDGKIIDVLGLLLAAVIERSPKMSHTKNLEPATGEEIAMSTYHIAMYPWFAMGHFIPYFEMANKLAARGHKISLLLPANTLPRLQPFNHHKHLIHCIPITVPSVDGLPPGAETTNDVPPPLRPLLMAAMDLTRPAIEVILSELKPQLVFFDFAYWVPVLTQKLGIKSLNFWIVNPASVSHLLLSSKRNLCQKILTEADRLHPPQDFPLSKIKLHAHEARRLLSFYIKDFGGLPFSELVSASLNECDAIAFTTCREIEGAYCDYIATQFKKPVLLAGPVVPEPPTRTLGKQWETLLAGFKEKSLIFCVFGSECIMEKTQFQELVLGFELTGLPFLAALKPPLGHDTIESALPPGFEERVKGRGYIHGGWIQQQLILKHPCVGCFVTHCGSGSFSEGLVSECQLVLVPNEGGQFMIARLMSGDLKVGIEIEKTEEDGLFTREDVCKAVKAAMDDDSEVGKEIRENHAKWREFLSSEELEKSYIDVFVQELHALYNEGSKKSE